MTLDQRASRAAPDLVRSTARRLNRQLSEELALPFTRTAGDEMQAVVGTGQGLVAAVTSCLADDAWWIGIGIGRIDGPLDGTAREGRGPAFWHAREAVDAAKRKSGPPGGVAVIGDPQHAAADLEAVLGALAFIIARRTERQRSAVALADGARGLGAIAKRLGVTPQAVSQILRAAGLEEQRRLAALATRLAEEVVR